MIVEKTKTCPRCKHNESWLMYKKLTNKGFAQVRKCKNCGRQFTVYETLVEKLKFGY